MKFIIAVSDQEFSQKVAAHADVNFDGSLWPGNSFYNLSKFLCSQFEKHPSRESEKSASQQYEFAIAVELGHRHQDRIYPLSTPADFAQWHGKSSLGGHSILLLRGYPSVSWLNTTGARLHVDAEVFRRHLDFRASVDRPDYLTSPPLPSSCKTMFKLMITTIGCRRRQVLWKQHQIDRLREKCDILMEDYVKTRSSEKG